MRNELDVKEQICQHCGTSLELFIEVTEMISAVILGQNKDEEIPTFNLELGDSEIKHEPFFKCPKCNTRAYEANRELEFDDINDILIFPRYDPDSKTGFKLTVYPPYPHSSITPKEEPPLPIIKRASAGEEIVSKVSEADDVLWAMGGYD